MNRQKLSQQVMWAILIPLLLVGCGAPAATPTSEPSPEPVVEVGDVIFDGTECTVSGSTELPPGRYSFVLKDQSELEVNLFVSRLTDGKTFQDLLDLQSKPGEYVPEQDWIDHAVELGSAWNKPDGGKVHTYIFIEEDALSQLAPQDRLSTPEQTLRDAKVRWPAKKAKWLDRNYKRIEKMGGLAAAKAALFGRPGREEKVKFLMSFTGIGPKYARNIMMDVYHPDFRDSIAIDVRIASLSKELGLSFDSYEEHEKFYLDIANAAGLSGWELDRLFFNFRDEIIRRLRQT